MSGFDNKLVLVGPYVGSLETEITAFKPFFDWLIHSFNFPNVMVSTHYNRSFLYNCPVMPIFKQYSHDERGQMGHRHDRINAKDYQYLVNDMKTQITEVTRWNKKDIVMYNLGYSATANYNSLSKKIFNAVADREDVTDEMLFIPHSCRSKKEMRKIYNRIKGLKVVTTREGYLKTGHLDISGQTRTRLKVVTTREGYLKRYNSIVQTVESYYEDMIKKIIRSRCVITPSSFWTLFCNIHNIPVFSGGDNISIYKTVYRFDNKQFKGIPFTRGNNINIVIESIEKFIGGL